MFFRQRGDQLLVQQRARDQTGPLHRRACHAQIQFAPHQTFELDSGDHLAQVDFHVGKLLARGTEQTREHDMGRRRGESDDDSAEVAFGDPLDGLGGALGELEDASRIGQEGDAGGGESDRAGGAVDELHAELAFELLDLAAQRRLGHVKAFGGTAEVQFLRDGDEAGQPGERKHRCTPRITAAAVRGDRASV